MAAPPEPRINDRIRAREVRLIAADGEQLGIRQMPEALSMARELGLDLVEVADKANPPVARIMDYGKYKYEAAQRAKESRKKASHVTVKEMKYRPKISGGDFNTKTRKVEKFLNEGHKVKITIMFRGREVTHPQLGRKILDDIIERTDEFAKVEAYPRLDGRNMTMVLGPDSKKMAKRARDEERAAAAEAAAEAALQEAEVAEADAVEADAVEAEPAEPETTEAPESEGSEAEASEAEQQTADEVDEADDEVEASEPEVEVPEPEVEAPETTEAPESAGPAS